ncbi:MAG: FadR/GntR family transcriptional regulator [Henriciella sp.]|nr:FadR/GntR family transcriptional regulator [Henriciella sp.]
MAGKPVKSRRLYQQIADRISKSIAAEEYPIGSRLPAERELSETFNVSRPTIREAVIALELEGLVEVRTGSGVYVIARPQTGQANMPELDIGPFELTEARKLFEGEAAALAAIQITDDQLDELESLIYAMEQENERGIEGEIADRAFHVSIAQATQNSAVVATIEMLWSIRDTSPMCVRMLQKARAKGVKPAIAEHWDILGALRARDPEGARKTMRRHLSRVIDGLLEATEVEAMQKARSEVELRRKRFAAGEI